MAQISITIADDILKAVNEAAADERRSRSNWIELAIIERLARQERGEMEER